MIIQSWNISFYLFVVNYKIKSIVCGSILIYWPPSVALKKKIFDNFRCGYEIKVFSSYTYLNIYNLYLSTKIVYSKKEKRKKKI